jgi:hydrogenase-4 component B
MEYTASSFAQPLTELFGHVLRARRRLLPPQGLFPRDAALATDTPDVVLAHVYTPLFAGLSRGLAALRWLQHGRVHLYVLYIALTLLALLVWKLG